MRGLNNSPYLNDHFAYPIKASPIKSQQVLSRENEGTEREAQGVGRDMSRPRKLFLDERKSLF